MTAKSINKKSRKRRKEYNNGGYDYRSDKHCHGCGELGGIVWHNDCVNPNFNAFCGDSARGTWRRSVQASPQCRLITGEKVQNERW